MWIASWAPAALFLPVVLAFTYHVIFTPELPLSKTLLWLMAFVLALGFAYPCAAFVALIVNYRRLEDLNERRRVRVLVVGSIAGLVPVFVSIMVGYLPMASTLLSQPVREIVLYAGFALLPLFPLSFTYAILRHQLFDIRVIIRNGLQYAAARGVLLYIVPASIALLILDLLLHKDQTLGTILTLRGWHYAVVIGMAFLAHTKRQSWMDALDRRFYRERYNAQQLLLETVEEIRTAASLDAVAPRVVARVEAALHPEFAALIVRDGRSAGYRPIAIAPSSAVAVSLDPDSKLLAVFRALGKPLAVSLTEGSWLKQQLPHGETEFLRNSRISLLVPVSFSADGREALFALGSKRSEEPYSDQDIELLGAISAGLALLLERPSASTPLTGFAECPKCGSCYDSGIGNCPVEGERLKSTLAPRLLASRYQLEKRLGQGGMGKVYKALDTALERAVAVKLIRDDLITNSEVAERFRREARNSASFAHPNLVTVHDFGVDGDTRAFLVMEYLEGETLRAAIRSAGRFDAARTLQVMRAVCSAMATAHHRQLVHRDLKPENIFLVPGPGGETTKVLDFGIAKFLPQAADTDMETIGNVDSLLDGALKLTTPGLLVGTAFYMSPEQLRGGVVQPAWDIWALSVIAYEMLSGGFPFDEKNPSECHRAILSGKFTPISSTVPDAPSSWQRFFDSAFHADPVRRPQSIDSWSNQLESSLRSSKTQNA